jgi:DNA-binding transcriptional LysR family regulator
MQITFRQLRLFLALAETGSVSAAARRTHVAQPTASMQLREMTDSIGLTLYEVVSRRVVLTEAGEELARTARAIADQWDGFEQRVAAIKGLTRGRLRVAVVSTAKYFVPRLLGSFCAVYPEIEISLVVLNRDGVIGRLRQNLDDLYIMSKPPETSDLVNDELMPNPLVLISSSAHRMAGRDQISLAELKQERFILREPGSGTRLSVDAHFEAQRFKPIVRLELGSNEAIREAVAGGLGLAVLSGHALEGRGINTGVEILPVAGFPIPSKWHLVYLRSRILSPIAAVFREHLLTEAQTRRERS